MYVVAVLEYMSTDIWKLVTGYVRHARQTEITSSDVKIALQTGQCPIFDMLELKERVTWLFNHGQISLGT